MKYVVKTAVGGYQSDPALLAQNATAPIVSTLVPAGATVYATSVPPTMSSDSNYELIQYNGQNLWVNVSALTVSS